MSQVIDSIEQKPFNARASRELCRRIQANDKTAETELVQRNIGLVYKHASKAASRASSLDLDDLVIEGVMGMLRAAKTFDVDGSTEFSTYSWFWIRAAVQQAMANQDKMIRLPAHVDSDPQAREAHEVRVSLFSELTNAEGEEFWESLIPGYEDEYLAEALAVDLGAAFDALTDQEQIVLRLRYLADRDMTLRQVATLMGGCSAEWIRQLEARAFDKLRCNPALAALAGANS